MSMRSRMRSFHGGGRNGVALVLVLAFVVLLTGLIIAFFTRSILDRQISNSSASQAKVSAFADGAANAIIGELEQEIVLTSSATPTTSGTLYIPLAPAGMLPQLSGTSGIPSLAPNLLKISGAGQLFYSGTNSSGTTVTIPVSGSSNVIAVSSTIPSLNGRYITPARWNEHYLLPLPNGATDSTPASGSFTPPSWVLVARDGSNPTALSPGMTTGGSNPVVGRYAYAIYHEGGLLDANVAGYPSTTSNNNSAYKPALAYADLTRIGLTQPQVDQLVSWRNATTIQPTGNFSSYTPPTASGSSYYNYVLSNTTGFLTVGGTADQMFTSRQELIQFFQNGLGLSGTSLNVLNYLTHFSRALEQPSYVPNPNRPLITPATTPPGTASTYQGNNTYAGNDAAINLTGAGFLSIRVANSFTRNDGSKAIVGEPLVKTRFALSRLEWLTYLGPSASRNVTTPSVSGSDADIYALENSYNVSPSWLQQGNATNIYNYFGLAWSGSNWVYNHGFTHIGYLSDVAAANREPDFAELLKAAIAVGSVGKAAYTNQGGSYSYNIDVSGDRQILQIMADLIDQTKTVNYPTIIYPLNNLPSTLPLYGVEDLPYFYDWHFFAVTTALPSPLLTNTNVVPNSALQAGATGNATHAAAGNLSNSGRASAMIVPLIWKPHDGNMPQVPGPSMFRVMAETTDPTSTLGYWEIRASPGQINDSFNGSPSVTSAMPPSSAMSPYIQLSASNATLQFTDATNGKAFREPTLLWRNNVPNGVTLSGSSRTEDASLTTSITGKPNTYFGIMVGDMNVSWSNVISGTSYVFQSSAWSQDCINGPVGCINYNATFRMQYWNGINWVTYQNSFHEVNHVVDYSGYSLFVNAADYPLSEYANPLQSKFIDGSALTYPMGGPFDPRTGRFGDPFNGNWNNDDPTLNGNPTLDATTMILNNVGALNASQNQAVAKTNFVLIATQRPSTSRGQRFTWDNPSGSYSAAQGFYSSTNFNGGGNFGGLFSQNNPLVNLSGGVQNYYEDPDGVCRRAMGGYVPVSGAGSGRLTNTSTTVGLPMATAWASTMPSSGSSSTGLGTVTSQSQSRPIILHRPFRNVAEMSYAFRGTPWKNIDFFTPESGDSALLDVFCVSTPPANALIAGKVNLNTRQAPVLQALFATGYRDEFASLTPQPSSGTLPALSATEAANLANALMAITGGSNSWQGPLTNVADLVGHFVYPNPSVTSGSDVYQYASVAQKATYTYAGFSAELSGTGIWDVSNITASQNIQRFRESAIRPLAQCGQTRVWNLMIDVIAQVGRYPSNASSIGNSFLVEGEKRYWVHLAIDRLTGQIVDRQVEIVPE